MPLPLCRREGAVLAETLVAAALLTVAMSFLVEFATQGLTESAMAQRRIRGALLAQEKMERILATRNDLDAWENNARTTYPQDPETGHRRFASEELEDFRWEWQLNSPDDHPQMREVMVRVFWRFPRTKKFYPGCEFRTLLAAGPSRAKGGTP
jgi:hypothetical protein